MSFRYANIGVGTFRYVKIDVAGGLALSQANSFL